MGGAANLESIRRAVAEALEQEPLAAAAYLYGSIARGAFTPLSDVDVADLDGYIEALLRAFPEAIG